MALGSFPISIEHTVQWGEMDALGHVNNANYLRWFESARIAYFEALKLGAESNWGPILGRATVDFRKSVKYPDVVTVFATVLKFGNTSLTMAYRAESKSLGVVAEGEAVVVLLDTQTGAKVSLPDELKRVIEQLETESP